MIRILIILHGSIIQVKSLRDPTRSGRCYDMIQYIHSDIASNWSIQFGLWLSLIHSYAPIGYPMRYIIILLITMWLTTIQLLTAYPRTCTRTNLDSQTSGLAASWSLIIMRFLTMIEGSKCWSRQIEFWLERDLQWFLLSYSGDYQLIKNKNKRLLLNRPSTLISNKELDF